MTFGRCSGTKLVHAHAHTLCIFAFPVRVGYKRPVPGVYGGNGKQIELETLTEPSLDPRSSDPRVFYIHNFLSPEEADEFIRYSTADENPYKVSWIVKISRAKMPSFDVTGAENGLCDESAYAK